MIRIAVAFLIWVTWSTAANGLEPTSRVDSDDIGGAWRVDSIERDTTYNHGQTGREVGDIIAIQPKSDGLVLNPESLDLYVT